MILRRVATSMWLALLLLLAHSAVAQTAGSPPPNEGVLGQLPITGTNQEHVTVLAVLPSLSSDMSDVVLRGVVRRDFELTGMFHVIPDSMAPPGLYGFNDPVDVAAWKKLGAEVIVKVRARPHPPGKVEVMGLCYFLNVGKDPVYQKTLLVPPAHVRITAHRITDALLGAITGRPGGFASHFTFSAKWGRNSRVFSMDSDGNDLRPLSDPSLDAIAPTWGPNETLFYAVSRQDLPFHLFSLAQGSTPARVNVPFATSIYSVAFNKNYTKMAVAVAQGVSSVIYEGNADGSGMQKVSTTPLATHPVFSPSGKLAWIGGQPGKGGERVYVDGKAISPSGFTAAAPAFCDTENGIRIVYAVGVSGNREDLVMSDEHGRGITRLTENEGSNTYPACSSDGRLLAFFSTRQRSPGIYFMSLKHWRTQKLDSQMGESLRWAPLPPPPASEQP
jgi:TolB protein